MVLIIPFETSPRTPTWAPSPSVSRFRRTINSCLKMVLLPMRIENVASLAMRKLRLRHFIPKNSSLCIIKSTLFVGEKLFPLKSLYFRVSSGANLTDFIPAFFRSVSKNVCEIQSGFVPVSSTASSFNMLPSVQPICTTSFPNSYRQSVILCLGISAPTSSDASSSA